MSSKIALVASLAACVALSADAAASIKPIPIVPPYLYLEEDAEEQGLSLKKVKKAVNKAGKVAGKVSNAYDKAQQIGVLEEEEWEANAGISGGNGRPQWNVGVSHKWEDEEEQKFKLKKTLGKVGKVAVVAGQVGLLEDEEEQKFKIGKTINKVGKVAGKVSNVYDKAQQIGVLEEGWEAGAGVSGGNGKPQWNVGVKGSWEEEIILDEQKFKLSKALKKATKVIVKADELGLLEEDAVEAGLSSTLKKAVKVVVIANELGALEDEAIVPQSLKLSKALKKVTKVVDTAQQLGYLEEEDAEEQGLSLKKLKKTVNTVSNVAVVAAQVGVLEEDEEVDEQGLSLKKVKKAVNKVGKAAGKVSNAYDKAQQIGVLDEDYEEQKFKLKKTLNKIGKVAVVAGQVGLLEEDEVDEQGLSLKKVKKAVNKVGKAAGKVSNAYDKAQQIGVLEEEEWEVGAGISGNGGKPQWNVGVSHKWEDEQDEQGLSLKKVKKAVNKVGKAAGKVSNAYDKAQQIGVLEEEEWEANAGISGGNGRPQWNVGVSHKWEEESPVARRFSKRF